MRKLLNSLAIAALLCAAACSPKVYPSSSEVKDSVRVEIHERLVHDTISIEIPREVERIVTRDTVSHLENSWAKSDASVDSLGFLHHSLESIPQVIYRDVVHEVTDTLVVSDKSEKEVVTVEKNVLTRWQSFWIILGRILCGVLIAAIVALGIKLYLKK